MSSRPVCVIIPVYNAFEETELCIGSVLAHSPRDIRVVVVDDASPKGELRLKLTPRLLRDRRLTIYRNPVNLGFVGTCNRAMLVLSGNDDVVLLNSDTEVTSGWVRKLQAAAYSRPNVGTVTPLTNNGVICSFPRFCEDNELIKDITLDELSHIVARASKREYPEIPTAIGFCMYIKREVLDTIGAFNATAFGKGYGEENDFCCRARKAGYVDILDDATFVYHKGSMSFGPEKAELCKKNEATLNAMHPDYMPRVAAFCGARPLTNIHDRILNELVARWSSGKRSVLHVLHNGPLKERRHAIGGTELHVQDLIREMPEICHWTLVPGKGCYYLSAHLKNFEREISINVTTELRDIIRRDSFDLVHVHHTTGFDCRKLEEALLAHGNYLLSLHDFTLLCPRHFLLTPQLKRCSGAECVSECGYKQEEITDLRDRVTKLIPSARAVICFSESTRNLFREIAPLDANWVVTPHGMRALPARVEPFPHPPRDGAAPFKVAFVGHLPGHKGAGLISEVAERVNLANGVPVEWHVLGKLYQEVPAQLKQHGEYARDTFVERIHDIAPHVVVIPSLCPESYSMTLDEAWSAGIPTVVTPEGALPERVKASGAGWILPELTPDAMLSLLHHIATHPEEYDRVKANVRKTNLIPVRSEALSHLVLYRRYFSKERAYPARLLAHLQPNLVLPQIEEDAEKGGRRAVVNAGFKLLERSGLRGKLQQSAETFLPPNVISALRELR